MADEKTITLKYESGKRFIEIWVKNEYYCPNCGNKSVWNEKSEGDYYVGELYLCVSCDHRFYLPSGTEHVSDNDFDLSRIEQLNK